MESVFKTGWMQCDESWDDSDTWSIMNNILEIRTSFNKHVKGNPRELDLHIHAANDLCRILQVALFIRSSSSTWSKTEVYFSFRCFRPIPVPELRRYVNYYKYQTSRCPTPHLRTLKIILTLLKIK